ncbi:MAG: hypothetical protein SGI71_02965 [Verrucomicrobiota bacterium]|nr:hypothetical protein [Verrucomicrobiota bacterium]
MFRKVVLVSLLAFSLCPLLNAAEDVPVPPVKDAPKKLETSLFKHPTAGWQIEKPEHWKIDESLVKTVQDQPKKGQLVGMFRFYDSETEANLRIYWDHRLDPTDVVDESDARKGMAESAAQSLTLINQEILHLKGGETYSITATEPNGEVWVKIWAFLYDRKRTYIIKATVPQESMDSVYPILENIIGTFKSVPTD